MRTRLQDMARSLRFAYHTLLEPWPPFLVYLFVVAVLGAIIPAAQVMATSGLIDALLAEQRRRVTATFRL